MKVIYVVDCISNLNQNVNLLKNKFGDNLFYVVRADIVELFKTYNYPVHAIYYDNLTNVMQVFLTNSEVEDTVIYYSSLKLNNNLLNKFTTNIADKTKIVSLMPQYNTFEQVCNSTYNLYVKSLFKLKDSMLSPKLQFIPQELMLNLLTSHLGNRLFETEEEFSKNITIEDKEINDSSKVKSPVLKFTLIATLIALMITIGLFVSIAYLTVNYLIVLICVVLYVLDFIITAMFMCKARFDKRFLK